MANAPYRIEFSPAARKQFEALPRSVQTWIRPRIDALANDPRPYGAVKIKGEEGQYRVRVGAYRVVYAVVDQRLQVFIVRIAHRRDVYRP